MQEGQKTELGHRFVTVRLKDGRHFELAVESEGYIIQVKDHQSIPFRADDVEVVETSSKRWTSGDVQGVAKTALNGAQNISLLSKPGLPDQWRRRDPI